MTPPSAETDALVNEYLDLMLEPSHATVQHLIHLEKEVMSELLISERVLAHVVDFLQTDYPLSGYVENGAELRKATPTPRLVALLRERYTVLDKEHHPLNFSDCAVYYCCRSRPDVIPRLVSERFVFKRRLDALHRLVS